MNFSSVAKTQKTSRRLFAPRLAKTIGANLRCPRRPVLLPVWQAQRVDQLDLEKLPALLRLKYPGAIADLGSPDDIRRLFAEFQQFLYQEAA